MGAFEDYGNSTSDDGIKLERNAGLLMAVCHPLLRFPKD
jgi:hypothetical protein